MTAKPLLTWSGEFPACDLSRSRVLHWNSTSQVSFRARNAPSWPSVEGNRSVTNLVYAECFKVQSKLSEEVKRRRLLSSVSRSLSFMGFLTFPLSPLDNWVLPTCHYLSATGPAIEHMHIGFYLFSFPKWLFLFFLCFIFHETKNIFH